MREKLEHLLLQTKRRRGWLIGAIVAMVVVIATFAWRQISINPLPNDEEMIAHFKAHRAELEAVVESYREYTAPQDDPGRYWGDTPEAQALLNGAGIRYVNNVGALWFPDPYSGETAKQAQVLRKNMGKRVFDLYPKYSSLYVSPADQRYYRKSLRYLTDFAIWKDFYHIPEVPKIENGKLWYPVDVDGKLKSGRRIFTSLNDYPPEWKRGECVFRQLEAHWFIQMCRAA